MQTNALPKTDETVTEDDVFYPEEDGKPMAESDFQRNPLIYCIGTLDAWFEKYPNVYVSGNLLMYYEKGNPSKSVAPDVFVVFGVPKYDRPNYKIWEEGKGPDLVIEIVSNISWMKDLENVDLYRDMGVREYFMYDPIGDSLDPVLQGYQLDAGENCQEMRLRKLPEGILKLYSSLLRMELCAESRKFRFFDPGNQEYLLSYSEQRAARLREQAESRAETGRLRERADRLLAESRADRAEAGRLRAEDELRKLKDKFRELGISPD